MASLPPSWAHHSTEGGLTTPPPCATRSVLLPSPRTGAHSITTTTSVPIRLRQPSILDLLTALPLLLALDNLDYAATLNGALESSAATPLIGSSSLLLRGSSSNSSNNNGRRCDDESGGDAATTAVFAVLRKGRGGAAWQAHRRRLRRVALDAFFRVSLPLQVYPHHSGGHGGGGGAAATLANSTDGVRGATLQLLAHTRAVLFNVSPTQAHLMDLFASRIMGRRRDPCDPVTSVQDDGKSGGRSIGEEDLQGGGDSLESSQTATATAAAATSFSAATPRSIMKTAAPRATTSTERCGAQASTASVPIAEQLLYIILRTSIAANTPRRVEAQDSPAPYCGCLGEKDALCPSSPTLTATSSTGSAERKKPRIDACGEWSGDAGGPAALFASRDADSIRHSNPTTSATTVAALPYEPQCWLGPATVALVERSAVLRRQQRWTCERDPVIEATIAGERQDTYDSAVSAAHAAAAAAAGAAGRGAVSRFSRRHSHWTTALVEGAGAENRDSAVLASLVRDGALPFAMDTTTSTACCAPLRRGGDGACGTETALHWGMEEAMSQAAVDALFAERRPVNVAQNPPSSPPSAGDGTAEGVVRRRDVAAVAASPAPVCRTPFVACASLYDFSLYARVYVALHRCTAGLVDPYELTCYDTQAGPNLVEIRVRPEFYAAATTQPTLSSSSSLAGSPHVRSGLTAMLEWGCRCGTLLLRLHRLCAVAEDATLRASLGNYGRSAMDTLRLVLYLLQRQMWELGDRAGGTHQLSFTELLTAQQRLESAAEQVEALAVFFAIPAVPPTSTPARTRAKTKSATAVAWDPVAVLQASCSSALLVSRLHQLFTTRHANALGQHGSANAITAYGDLQRVNAAVDDGRVEEEHADGMVRDGTEKAAHQQQRKELLSTSLDVIGFLFRATLRPLNAMLHRWLTAGELSDPYDEFFVVPSHGSTHSGFTLDLSPQRLPVFISPAAAADLLHAGVSLRVLRAAATHVVRSAQKDTRRLQGLAEMTDAAAEDYAEEVQDTLTLRCAIEAFIERLVRGVPHVSGLPSTRHAHHREGRASAAGDDALPMPLPPRVDALAVSGAPERWRQHYHACTQVLLTAVEASAVAAATAATMEDEEGDGGGAAAAAHAEDDVAAMVVAVSETTTQDPPTEASQLGSAASAVSALPARVHDAEGEAVDPDERPFEAVPSTPTVTATTAHHLTYPLGIAPTPAATIAGGGDVDLHKRTLSRDTEGSGSEAQPYITVFMNSDDDEDGATYVAADRTAHHENTHTTVGKNNDSNNNSSTPFLAEDDAAASSRSSSPASLSSAATTSVLGLRRIAGSKFSTSSTISSTASSRGTVALYGAITEELRQVSLLEQQTEVRAGQSRQALRAEFAAQLWRRRRETRLGEWKAQRLALRLHRLRAMEGLVEELRGVYGIHGVGYTPAESSTDDTGHPHHSSSGGGNDVTATAAAARLVIPVARLPPPRSQPPVVLYAETGTTEAERESRQPRRMSFAATTTIVELPGPVPTSSPWHPHALPSSPLVGVLMPPRHGRTRSSSGPSLQSSAHAGERPVRTSVAQRPLLLDPSVSPSLRGFAMERRSSSSPAAALTGSTAAKHMYFDLRGAPPRPSLSLSSALSARGVEGVRHLSDVTADALAELGATRSDSAGRKTSTLLHNEQAIATEATAAPSTAPEEADAEAAAEAPHTRGVQRDELGYAHPDACYAIADINDDDYLFARVGPKSYARREAEVAALARLAEGRAELDRCTVDRPGFLQQLKCTAASMKNDEEGVDEEEQGGRDALAHDSTEPWLSGVRPTALSATWRRDDPLDDACYHHQQWRCHAQASGSDDDEGERDCTGRLWSWTPAEAHRWYFDTRLPLHHVLTSDAAVDRALLREVPLRAEEATALQCCGGYYRALGHYTAGFLTHKALQLTLLPPYGSLYRLTTQFLDVCLLQRSTAAVRIVDAWIAALDTALEMSAERDEVAMASAAVAGVTDVPAALASLTDTQHGLDLEAALTALNVAFQSEWAACVAGGEATVTLAWTLSRSPDGASSTQPPQQRQYHAYTNEEELSDPGDCSSSSSGDDDEERQGTRVQPPQQHQVTGAVAGDAAAARTRRTSSPIQAFLASLRLTPVTPWCSGAWLLPDDTTASLSGIFRALLFWKSVERVVLHTWRAGMASGLSSVFFFCTTVRQVLLSTLHEPLWGRLTELAASYRDSLRFEAGVLYTYRALESFTLDHARFLRDCEFYTLCSAPFQRRVRPLLSAMMRQVEVAERAVRFGQVATRVARRQYMTTFHSMVSSGSSSSSDDDDDDHDARVAKVGRGKVQQRGGAAAHHGKHATTTTVAKPPQQATIKTAAATTAKVGVSSAHVFTPSRWSLRHLRGTSTADSASSSSASQRRQPTPWYMRPLEDALAQHPPSTAAAAAHHDGAALIASRKASKPRRGPSTADSVTSYPRSGTTAITTDVPDTRSASARSSATAATTSASRTRTVEEEEEDDDEEEEEADDEDDDVSDERERHEAEADHESVCSDGTAGKEKKPEEDVPPAEATKKKRRKKRKRRAPQTTTAKGPPRRSIMETATMNTTPFYAAVLGAQQQRHRDVPTTAGSAATHKRSRSAAVGGTRQASGTSSAVVVVVGGEDGPPTPRRPRRGHGRGGGGPQGPRLTPAERQERRTKLRLIANRKIADETASQRRRMRDVIARRLRRFATLTTALRDALGDIVVEEDLSAQSAMLHTTDNAAATAATTTTTSARAKELHDARRAQMSRFAYLSSMIRRLDSLLEVMASQV